MLVHALPACMLVHALLRACERWVVSTVRELLEVCCTWHGCVRASPWQLGFAWRANVAYDMQFRRVARYETACRKRICRKPGGHEAALVGHRRLFVLFDATVRETAGMLTTRNFQHHVVGNAS